MVRKKIIDQVQAEIDKLEEMLIERAKIGGIYENFGQNEVRNLQDKYQDYQYKRDADGTLSRVWDAIMDFDDWCMSYTGD